MEHEEEEERLRKEGKHRESLTVGHLIGIFIPSFSPTEQNREAYLREVDKARRKKKELLKKQVCGGLERPERAIPRRGLPLPPRPTPTAPQGISLPGSSKGGANKSAGGASAGAAAGVSGDDDAVEGSDQEDWDLEAEGK